MLKRHASNFPEKDNILSCKFVTDFGAEIYKIHEYFMSFSVLAAKNVDGEKWSIQSSRSREI